MRELDNCAMNLLFSGLSPLERKFAFTWLDYESGESDSVYFKKALQELIDCGIVDKEAVIDLENVSAELFKIKILLDKFTSAELSFLFLAFCSAASPLFVRKMEEPWESLFEMYAKSDVIDCDVM